MSEISKIIIGNSIYSASLLLEEGNIRRDACDNVIASAMYASLLTKPNYNNRLQSLQAKQIAATLMFMHCLKVFDKLLVVQNYYKNI